MSQIEWLNSLPFLENLQKCPVLRCNYVRLGKSTIMLVKLPDFAIDIPKHYIFMRHSLSVCIPEYDDARAPYVTARGFFAAILSISDVLLKCYRPFHSL